MGANHSPALPLLAWLLHVGGPCTVCLSSPSEKSLPGTSVPLRATVGRPHSPTLWQVHSLSGSWTVMASHGPPPLLAPGVTRIPKILCPSLGTLPAVCCLLPSPVPSPPPTSDFMCPGLSWIRSGTSLPWEGRELLGCYHWPGSRPMSLGQPQSLVPSPRTFPIGLNTSLPPVLRHPLHTLASKIHISWLFTLFFGRFG